MATTREEVERQIQTCQLWLPGDEMPEFDFLKPTRLYTELERLKEMIESYDKSRTPEETSTWAAAEKRFTRAAIHQLVHGLKSFDYDLSDDAKRRFTHAVERLKKLFCKFDPQGYLAQSETRQELGFTTDFEQELDHQVTHYLPIAAVRYLREDADPIGTPPALCGGTGYPRPGSRSDCHGRDARDRTYRSCRVAWSL